ncbi:hypothetical protein VPH35_016319 [Triticum aestivum]
MAMAAARSTPSPAPFPRHPVDVGGAVAARTRSAASRPGRLGRPTAVATSLQGLQARPRLHDPPGPVCMPAPSSLPPQAYYRFLKSTQATIHVARSIGLYKKKLQLVMDLDLACVYLDCLGWTNCSFMHVGLPNVGKSTFFNIVTKVGSRAGNSRDNFRKEYKEKHPDVKQVSMIGKAGGEKLKSMSDVQVLCSCTRLAPSPARWSFLRRPA